MPQARQRLVPFVAAALAALLAGCGDGQGRTGAEQALAAQRVAGHALFWVGPEFEGLALTSVDRRDIGTTFAYGTCKPPDGEGGCAPPLQIQVAAICDDHTLELAIRPRASFTARGTRVRDFGEGRLELDAADAHVKLFAAGARGHRAIAALKPVSGRATARLPAATYPRHYLERLRRVRDAYVRGGSLHAVREELGISVSAARFHLSLARELGPARLRGGRGIACGHAPH